MIPEILDSVLYLGFGGFLLLNIVLFCFSSLRQFARFLLSAWLGSFLLTVGYRIIYHFSLPLLLDTDTIDPNTLVGYILIFPVGLIFNSILAICIGAILGVVTYFRILRGKPGGEQAEDTKPDNVPS